MASGIRTLIKLNKKQTKEFLASLNDNRNEKARKKFIRKAMKMKFNVIK